jgi:hypothetical protein
MTVDLNWTGETVWQVRVIGFFFVGQVDLPQLLGSPRWYYTAPETALPCWADLFWGVKSILCA